MISFILLKIVIKYSNLNETLEYIISAGYASAASDVNYFRIPRQHWQLATLTLPQSKQFPKINLARYPLKCANHLFVLILYQVNEWIFMLAF